MEHQTAQTPTEPTQEKASRWEDYIDVFFSPTELFRRRAQDKVAPPLLTLIALGILFYIILLPATQMVIRASVQNMPAEQQAAMTDGAIRMMSWFGLIGVPIMYLFMTFIAALILWLGGRLADIRIDFGRAMLIATYSSFILLLSQVLASVLAIALGEASFDPARSLSFGPLRFMGSPDMNPVVTGVLQRFEIFAIWQAVVWAIGLKVLYKVSTARAAIVAAATWLFFILPGAIGALFSGGPNAG